jgi:ATP-dependent protease ClpP protease subunit
VPPAPDQYGRLQPTGEQRTETGQSVERVRKDTDRNYWMSASEAIDYGVANKIISSFQDLK